MHVYKLKAHDFGEKSLEKTAFERDTKKEFPWYQKQDGKARHFAVCPACDNTTRIVGLYEPLPHTDRPYGMHVGKRVEGFPYFDPSAFDWCPYVEKNRKGKITGKRPLDDIALKILAIALTQFDRVIHILQKNLGFRFSNNLAQQMLESWLAEEGYRYRAATLRNIPWMMAYRSVALRLFGQTVHDDALKADILAGIPAARLDETGKVTKGTTFYKIMWCCLDHQIGMDDGRLVETMEFNVWSGRRDTVIHRKVITFEPEYFDRLVKLPPEREQRNETLLELAHKTYCDCLSPALLQQVMAVARDQAGDRIPAVHART